jgi:ERCC4-type nuclease
MSDKPFIPGVPTKARQPLKPSKSEKEQLPGIGPEIAEALRNAGFGTVDSIKKASDAQLLAIPGIGKTRLETIRATLESEVRHD